MVAPNAITELPNILTQYWGKEKKHWEQEEPEHLYLVVLLILYSINTLYEPASFNGPRYYKAFSKITPFIPLVFLDSKTEQKKDKNCQKKNKKTSGAMRGVARWWRGEEVATSEKYIFT